MINENGNYDCDKCEKEIDESENEEIFEVRYGFICKQCAGH